jgi:hypothetical protein
MERADLLLRATTYANRRGLVIGEELGSGVHGTVLRAKNQTNEIQVALKVFMQEAWYVRERDVYERLRARNVTQIRKCTVPEMLGHDPELYVIEMTIVTRPFVLDFAGAYLDRPPEFSEEVLADWHAEKLEQFGARWREAQAVLRELETYGIFMIDVNPGNIGFVD